MSPPSSRTADTPATRRRIGRVLELLVGLYGAAIFAVLWIGFAVGLAAGGAVFVEAWAWLTGLEPFAAIVAWVLLLPIAVGLWAWNAVGSPLVTGMILAGLVAWTFLAVAGLARTLRRR